MGKGDRRSAKGKRFAGSFGNARPKAKNTVTAKPAAGAAKKKPAK